MSNVFDIKKLQQLLKDFYAAVGIRISVFDERFCLVAEYPIAAPKYCSYIRTIPKGAEGCRNCDFAACKRAEKKQEAHIYVCHAGVTEAITPIRFENGVLGYIILAHMMPLENYEQSFENAVTLCKNYGLDPDLGKKYLSEIAPRSQEQILASTHLLDAVSSCLYVAKLVKKSGNNPANRIDGFIRENLHLNLTSNSLCKQFLISRTKLYMLAKECFGVSISQHVCNLRIQTAKKLLKESDLSLAKIAQKVGLSNENYFCKVFKKETGFTPSAYRKQSI
jgi:AraC-like DNA-binding protein